MPIYEYVCQACGKKTEAIQRMGDKKLTVCPHCGGRLKKAFSAPAIQFKGAGWYVTDYARGGGEDKAGKGSQGEKSEGEKADKADKAEKAEKADKGEKAEKAAEKADKAAQSEKPAKAEKKGKKADG